MQNISKCVVFICDYYYLAKFVQTCHQLVTNGGYNGQICLIIGDDLATYDFNQIDFLRSISDRLIIKHFNNINFGQEFLDVQMTIDRPHHWKQKLFQYHKLNLFDEFFKQWTYIFYIDCGMTIFDNIQPILNECTEGCFFANRDGVDGERGTGLLVKDQFIDEDNHFNKLKNRFGDDLNCHAFQTTIMLFDTRTAISHNTKKELIELAINYPVSKTNDQGIIGLYFTLIKPMWKQIRRFDDTTYFYDYVPCVRNKYIMIKFNDNGHIDQGYIPNYNIRYKQI